MTGRLAAYARQRFPIKVFGPVVVALAAIARWAAGTFALDETAALAVVLMALLVVFFRVWDDIEDRGQDRVAHPDRVLPRGPLALFLGLQGAIGMVAGALLLTRSAASAAGFTALAAAACVGYRMRARVADAAWSYALLLKYPACVAIVVMAIGVVRPGRLAIAMVIAYAGACAYEDLHNRFSRPIAHGAATT